LAVDEKVNGKKLVKKMSFCWSIVDNKRKVKKVADRFPQAENACIALGAE